MTANALPEKPTLDGIEAKWAQVWEDNRTYRFDREWKSYSRGAASSSPFPFPPEQLPPLRDEPEPVLAGSVR